MMAWGKAQIQATRTLNKIKSTNPNPLSTPRGSDLQYIELCIVFINALNYGHIFRVFHEYLSINVIRNA